MKSVIFLFVAITSAACGNRTDVQCEQSSNCDLGGGGMCLATPSGNQWCAYPDPECPGGYRYSDFDVGDGVSGECAMRQLDAGVDPPLDASPDGPDAPVVPADYVVTYGGTAGESIGGLHAIADGLLVTGTLESNAALETFQLTPGAGANYVTAKLDASGNVLWARTRVRGGSETDAAGNLLLVGEFGGSLSFGGPTLAAAGGYDIYIAKYSGVDGGHLFSVRYGSASDERPRGITVDAAGDIYVSGTFGGTANLGGANVTSAGLADGFIAKYRGSDGVYLWGIRFGGTDNDTPTTVAVVGSRVVVCGVFRGTANFGGSNLVSQGQDDTFLASYDAASGVHAWSNRYGGTSNDSCSALASDGVSVFMTGTLFGPSTYGGTTLLSQGLADIFVAKYDGTTGSHVWSKAFGGAGIEVSRRMINVDGNLVLTGRFETAIDFGGGALGSAGGSDIFVATITDADGSYVDAWRAGGTNSDEGTTLTSTVNGIVVGGYFSGVTYFGPLQATSVGMTDAFVFRP